ncbi:hypothetical protein QP162_08380 [Sphingomonas aurantiaca]|uniref:hypothetical protein n=1 Tax=Sphingomonas aurantiaca TaxID=185949 RepID=UPI002FE1749A
MTARFPGALAAWAEAARVRSLNAHDVRPAARYVLCWLQQALRARDNPVIDAAICLGNDLGLPVLVYHGLREDYPYASDRLHRFILGASRDLARECRQRGLASVHHVDRAAMREKGSSIAWRRTARRCWSRISQPSWLAGSRRGSPRAAIARSSPSTPPAWCRLRFWATISARPAHFGDVMRPSARTG